MSARASKYILHKICVYAILSWRALILHTKYPIVARSLPSEGASRSILQIRDRPEGFQGLARERIYFAYIHLSRLYEQLLVVHQILCKTSLPPMLPNTYNHNCASLTNSFQNGHHLTNKKHHEQCKTKTKEQFNKQLKFNYILDYISTFTPPSSK